MLRTWPCCTGCSPDRDHSLLGNLSMLWTDRAPLQRFDAAAAAGFTHVEMLFPQALPGDDLEAALERNGLLTLR